MYNQGNYQQFGQRLPALPLPPPPPFQQGPPAPQNSLTQQGRPSIPPHVGQAGPPPYALASSASMQLGPPVSVSPSGTLSSSQSYLIPPPPPPPHVHGSTSTPHSYSSVPQSSNWSQNQHISPPIPPPGHHLTPRIPPPHPQGQHFYRVPAPPLLPGGIRGIHQAPPPLPPPPTSSYFSPAPFGSFVQPAHEPSLGHLPPPPPPPPPSSPPPGPPPLPPSSPPPNSPLHSACKSPSTAAELSPSSRKPAVVDMVASGVIDRSNGIGHRSNDTLRHHNSLNCTGVNGSETSLKDTSDFNIMSDIPPPPPRPRDEKTVRKIEVLCQYIAKNGHEFEDITCQKEVGNPEFEFLFGGTPGSEATISHEYFKWMKNKYSSSGLLEGRHNSDISLKPSGVGSSMQPDDTMHAGISNSPAGSDMDMEDDITQPEESGIGKSFRSAKHEPAFTSYEVEEHACDSEHISHKDATDGNLFCSESSGVIEQGANLSQDDMQSEKLSMKDGDADSEWCLDSKAEQHNISLHQEMNRSGASAAVKVSSTEVPGELIRGTSPFRLIQDYASDDSSENDSEPHLENICPGELSPQVKEGTTGLDALQTDIESKHSSELDKGLGPLSVPVVEGSLNTASKLPEPSTRTEGLENKTDSYLVNEQVEQDGDGHHSQAFVDGGTSIMNFKQNDRLEGGAQKEDSNAKLEVDEFGRMVKAGASDSDSDDYTRWRGKRGRSRSRSRSPTGRRRRSPRRRREKRSRSRSWSPRKRSRSRSPYRHGAEAGGDWTRRNRSHLPICYDFRRGKCFRGGSCRYLHDSDKIEESRRHKNKQQYQEIPDRLKSSDKLVPEKDDVSNQEMQLYPDRSSDRIKEEFVEPAGHCAVVASAHETLDVNKLVGNVPAPLLMDVDGKTLLGIENTGILQSQANLSGPLLRNSSDQLQQNTEHPATDHRSAIPGQLSIGESPLNQMSPAEAQLPLPSLSKGTHAPIPSQLPREYNVMPTSNYPSHSASAEIHPPYQAPLSSEHPQLSGPPASSWNPLPPPPPRPQLGGPLSQYQQNQPPLRINYPFQAFVRPYAPELSTNSQVGESHLGLYPPAPDSQRPLSRTEDIRPRAFPVNYPTPQQPGGPRIFGEENFARIPSPSLVSSNSNAQGDIHPHSLRFSREPPAGIIQSFSGENVPPGGLPVPSSEGHAYMSRYSLQNPVADSISTLGEPGKINLRYATDFSDGGQVSGISDFGRSRISSHYNPYASTFDQPLSTKFSSGVFSQETGTSYSNKYGASVGQSHIPDEGQGVGSIRSRNMNTSPTSMRYFARDLPRSGGDQYDPLFDSIEPSSNSFRKSDHGNKIEGTDDPDMLRLSGSNKLLDLEENIMHKEVAVAASTSVENDEFGETADAEVGAVENDSPSSPIDLPDVATGEIEIDQVKNPGKSKKSKDSRSMKLFKVALADFVKEVLKPSWRQGNMSKEAFKTIVKKTVDKVSGAMKKHQLPKSQAKINQYIDSSQRKLTKLVMGYVDKYVKV